MDKHIPLSELIRIGAKVSKQTRGALYNVRRQEKHTCAIGAAYLAKHAALPEGGMSSGLALSECGIDPNMMVLFPQEVRALHQYSLGASGCLHTLNNVIVSLNDTYKWSREMIADWLQSINL